MTGGLIAAALEQELLSELRRQGIVVWLDGTGYFTPFVDSLAARTGEAAFAFPVVAFRGSFVEVVLALEPFGSGLDNAPLLIHMPGFTEETIRKTPALELYEAGTRFRKAPDTLIREVARGRVAPEALEQFLATGVPTLADADAWLDGQLTSTREGLAGLLEKLGILAVLDGAVEVLQRHAGYLANNVSNNAALEVFEAFLGRQTGMDAEWLRFFGENPEVTPLENAATALMGWLLSVEYVHDLARPPHLPALARIGELSPPLVKACQGYVHHLREKHQDVYATIADEVELHLHEELPAIRSEDLGKVDTFRVEETRVLAVAVDALKAGEWQKARAWADVRTEETSFWLKRDQTRRRAWVLVREAAALGVVLAGQPRPLEGARTIEDAVTRYTSVAFEVDRAHRRFEQRQTSLLDSQLPHFGELKEVVRLLRGAYRNWADRLAGDFASICRENGFLPDATLQQRYLFEQVVGPIAGEDRVALFLLDAFRYEMATELLEDLKTPGAVVDLKARLAELPTITPVGMNALAPVNQDGRLKVAGLFAGFKTGEFTVRTPDDRTRAIGMRSGGKQSVLLPLADVCDLQSEVLKKRIKDARVIVVHGTEFDDAGEANVGPATFETSLRQLRSAYAQLQKAGVKSFVFSADHGFLLLDDPAQRAVTFGTKRDPHRRYVLDDNPRAEPGMLNVSLPALGYEGLEGYLLFREDTAVFATGNSGATFVHGGNSLQERVIPVLTVRRSRPEGKAHTAYLVEATRLPDLMGVRRVRLRVRVAPDDKGQLGFVAAKEVALGIRAVGQPEVLSVLKDLSGSGTIRDGALRVPVSEEWCEVCFTLNGPSAAPVKIEIHHPEGAERVQHAALPDWFEVDWKRGGAVPVVVPPDERELDWADALTDAGARAVFVHLAKHGSVTEAEVTKMVGSPRAFRRFSLDFEEHARKVPFRVRIETAADGKRYVKEGEK